MAPCEFQSSRRNSLRRLCVSERSRCGAVRFFTWPAHPLRRLRVSEHSRCGSVRISKLAEEPSAEIVRVGALSLWRRANFKARGGTLCGDCACRSALAVAPCEFQSSRRNPLRRLCVSERSRCGAVRISRLAEEPSAEIVRVGALSLWRRANFNSCRRTFCGDCACRIALAVAPCEFESSAANPLRRLCVSNRSRCGAVRISNLVDEPSAEIVRVESLSLCRRANFKAEPSAEIARVGSLSQWFSQNLSTKVVCEARSRSSA